MENDFDVIVIGSGASGISAALTAQEAGKKALLLEKGRTTGGSSNYTEGLFAIDSFLQKEQGIKVSKLDVLNEEVNYSKYKADSRIWRKYLDNSAENVKWLSDQGVEYEGVQAMGDGEATWHIYKGMGYSVIHDTLEPKFVKLGGTILTSTSGKKINKNNDASWNLEIKNEITGKISTLTSKVIVLASGGYLDSKTMMAKDTQYDISRLVPVSCGKNTGDGLSMAWEAGAKKYSLGTAMLFGGYLKDDNEPSFKMMESQMNTAAGQNPNLWVNQNGERFVDESVIFNFSLAGNALYTQKNVFSIMDTNLINKMTTQGNFMGLGIYVRRGQKMTNLQDEIDAAIKNDKSFIFKADTISELAEKMNMSEEKLINTISKYNSNASNGIDSEFGKNKEFMQPILKAPFYGFKLNVGAFCTMGGLKVTSDNCVLDSQENIIPGLYAVGNDASGLTGDTYGPNMPGTCVGYAFYSGRNAGKDALEYINKF